MTTQQQIHEALETWIDAHHAMTNAAAAYLEFRRLVGSNEAERKTQKANTPPEEYERNVQFLAQQEITKLQATAAAERTEKVLNVLRELLPAETADVNRATAEIADRTAQRYAVLSMAPPARPIVMHKPVTDDSDLPF